MDTDVYGVDHLKGDWIMKFDDDIDSKFAKFDLAVKTLPDNNAATALKATNAVTNDISTITDFSTINVYDKSNKVIVETNPFGSNADNWPPKDEKIEPSISTTKFKRKNKKKFHVSLK